jgi:hypothetical protein
MIILLKPSVCASVSIFLKRYMPLFGQNWVSTRSAMSEDRRTVCKRNDTRNSIRQLLNNSWFLARETAHGTGITYKKHNRLKLKGELLLFLKQHMYTG